MEWALVIIIALVAWWIYARRKRDQAERQRELTQWEFHEDDEFTSSWWLADFPSMRMRMQFRFYDYGSQQPPDTLYLLRRSDRGVWQAKMTEESYRAELHRTEVQATERLGASAFAKQHLAELQKGNRWVRLRDEMQGSLETAYQRYLRQG